MQTTMKQLRYAQGLDRFCKLLPFNAHVVDISNGHGVYANRFAENEYRVTVVQSDPDCAIIDEGERIKVVRRPLDLVIMPFRTIAGIWAEKRLGCLSKDKLNVFLGQFIDWLQIGGIIYFVVAEGEGYKLTTERGLAGQKHKLVVYHTPEEIEIILQNFQYKTVDAWYENESDRRWIHVIAKRQA